ncbi:MAG: nucleotide exchange factor GrpE [Candidatus Uhrbacteria bacterium]
MSKEHDEQQDVPTDEQQEHESCEQRITEIEAKWKRALADLQNQERAHARAREQAAKFSNSQLLREILPLVDSIRAAAAHVEGLDGLEKACDEFLRFQGVERVIADGAVDLGVHEVIGKRAEDGVDTDTILEVALDGYSLYGECLRPAKVIVAE